MKLGILLLAGLLAAMPATAAPVAEIQPNVLLIISDDQGYGDFGFNGNKLVRTPNLDRLAAESAVFRNFTVAAACSPTRAAVFTGRDHLLTGVWGVPTRANLRPDEARMPAFFKAAGYRTLHVGKLDCAKMGNRNPQEFGWDDWIGGGAYEHRDPMMFMPKNSHRGQGWTADLWTDYMLQYVREHCGEPWFLSAAYIIPHMPWECDAKYSAPFVAQGCSESLAACYGSIAHLDECVGRLLHGLRETGQDQRTIVIFISDNGATSPEAKHDDAEGNVPGEDWVKRNVANLRGHKAMVWENGIRVPCLVRWPGRIEPGERKQFGCAEDLLPTLLDLSGVKPDGVPHLPFSGVSLRPALQDAAATFERPAVFRMAIAGEGSPREGITDVLQRKYGDHHLTLRGPRYKYHALPGGASALYDLAADPGETADVREKFPEVASQMAAECRARWEAIIASGRSFAPPQATEEPLPAKGGNQ
jgi:arylsulfatase A-like enzyme